MNNAGVKPPIRAITCYYGVLEIAAILEAIKAISQIIFTFDTIVAVRKELLIMVIHLASGCRNIKSTVT